MRVLLMLSCLALSGSERSLVSVLPYLKKIEGAMPFLCTLNTYRDSPLVDDLAEKLGINVLTLTPNV